MHPDDFRYSNALPDASGLAADPHLVERLRAGDSEAGRRFVRDHYPAIYHYLLYLTGRPEAAEDLTQETFLQAWRRLDTFEEGAPLRPWLHRIAHREFLQALRKQRPQTCLDEISEIAAPGAAAWAEGVELRVLIARLPLEARELVVLHDLEGYTSEEIGRIVGKPAGTVRYQLSAARARLRRELREGDLAYLNQSSADALRRWHWLPLDTLTALEARLSLGSSGWLKEAAAEKGMAMMSDRTSAGMSRRKLLEAAGTAAAAAGLAGPAAALAAGSEAEIIDDRLTRKVTLAVKAIALADLCDQLRSETGIRVSAGPSVADEKVTVFCVKLPLREVMRQLSRPFGYTWLRSKEALGVRRQALGENADDTNAQRPTPDAQYRYELVQDLRSQLLEEELRNRDLNAALLALDAQMQQYRPYLDTSFEALQKLWEQGGEPAGLLSHMVHNGGWGGIQLYHHLTPRDRAVLVAGEEITFRPDAPDQDHRLPAEWERPLLQALSHRVDADGHLTPVNVDVSGQPTLLSELPGIHLTQVRLKLNRSELGQVSLVVMMVTGFRDAQEERLGFNLRELATSRSPSVANLDNATANARLRNQPPFDRRVTLHPNPSCPAGQSARRGDDDARFDRVVDLVSPHVTSAEVWEAVHRATGLPIVADYYTRLYPLDKMTLQDQPLFEALCTVGDALGARWRKDDDFLVCRSARYFWDKLKEVPNRYLQRWTQDRDASGGLPLTDFLEMASMTDPQLDSDTEAKGIEQIWGLREWAWLGGAALEGRLQRQHARFLATLAPEQRRRALEPAGLPFAQLTPAQQQGVLRLQYEIQQALEREEGTAPSIRPEELANARITAKYIAAGWYAALAPPKSAWERSWNGPLELVGGRTAAEATAAARRLDPQWVSPEVRRLRDGYFRADIQFDQH